MSYQWTTKRYNLCVCVCVFTILTHSFTEMNCVWYETNVAASKSEGKHDKGILKSSKHTPIRENFNDSSKLYSLKFNQSAVGPMEDEDSRKLIKPFNESTSHYQVKTKRNLLKRTHSFQPCNTCKQIVQQRKSISMLSYRSTPHPVPVTPQLGTPHPVPVTPQLDTPPPVPVTPQLDTQPTRHNVSKAQAMAITSGMHAPKSKAETTLLLHPEKSTLLQSKERIEGLLKMKRRQLQFLVSL